MYLKEVLFVKIILIILKSPIILIRWLFHKEMSGEEFEEYAMKLLQKNGYKNVTLTKKSHDYGVDILAKKKKKTYAIQCKYYSKPVGVSAIQQAYAGCEYYGYDIPVVMTNQTFTRQAVALAQANHVYLWDQDMLKQLKRKGRFRSLFIRKHEVKDIHPYHDLIYLMLEEGYVSRELLKDCFHYSDEKVTYVLDDLQFYDLISPEDNYGVCDLYFSSYEEAMANLAD